MELLNTIGSICSIIGLLVALFVAQQVVKISNSVRIKGQNNKVAGRDMKG